MRSLFPFAAAASFLFILPHCLSAFQAPPGQTDQTAGNAKPGSVTGKVVNAVTGVPLRKVKLNLTGAAGQPAGSAESDDQGAFAFADLTPGQYHLRGSRNGFSEQPYAARPNSMLGTPLRIASEQKLTGLTFKLWPDAIIAGKVLDEDGEALANVMVMAMRPMYLQGQRQLLPAGMPVQTNELGEYRISQLKSGKYLVTVTLGMMAVQNLTAASKPADDKPERAYTTTYYPDATSPSQATYTTVKPGEEVRGVDVRMRKVDAYRVAGTYKDSEGGMKLALLTPRGAGLSGMISRSMGMLQPDGSFEIRGVTAGEYVLSFTKDGMNTVGTQQSVIVTDHHVQGLKPVEAKGGELAGVVRTVGGQAPPVKGASVRLYPMENFAVNPPYATASEDGRFTLKNVAPGRYQVTAHLTGGGAEARPEGPAGNAASTYLKSVQQGNQELADNTLDLSAGVAGALEVTFANDGATISGEVRDEKGIAVEGISILLIPPSHAALLFKETTADQSGAFRFQGVAPGEYLLVATEEIGPGEGQDPEILKGYESQATRIAVKANAQAKLTLKPVSLGTAAK
jgi:protocatechuate 3,4-dioxygenase beta subunit